MFFDCFFLGGGRAFFETEPKNIPQIDIGHEKMVNTVLSLQAHRHHKNVYQKDYECLELLVANYTRQKRSKKLRVLARLLSKKIQKT